MRVAKSQPSVSSRWKWILYNKYTIFFLLISLFASILNLPIKKIDRIVVVGQASALPTFVMATFFFWQGVRRVVSIWNFGEVVLGHLSFLKVNFGVRSHIPPHLSRPSSASFWPLSHFEGQPRPLKINGDLTNSYSYFVWIFSIDWYLNWPHWTFISWDMLHERILGGVGMGVRGWKKKHMHHRTCFCFFTCLNCFNFNIAN